MVVQDEDEPALPPPAALGEILRRAYEDDYHADLRFELISLLLVLAHDAREGERGCCEVRVEGAIVPVTS